VIHRSVLTLLILTACSGSPTISEISSGGSSTVGGASSLGGTKSGGGVNSVGGSANTGGSTTLPACGAQFCASDQICVHPGCGGGVPPACSALNDAGACPSGWTYSSSCYNLPTAGPGCLPPPCVPPPAFCFNIPAGCGSPITCSCLPGNICAGGGCGLIENGTDVVCMAA
jgi:hypothetical protein